MRGQRTPGGTLRWTQTGKANHKAQDGAGGWYTIDRKLSGVLVAESDYLAGCYEAVGV